MTALRLEARHTTATGCAAAASRAAPGPSNGQSQGRERTLALSRMRTHDAVLDILKAYKLSGNFHTNLDLVLKDMGVSDMVTCRSEPHPAFAVPDRRHVVFTFRSDVPDGKCDGIVRAIEARIGFGPPWWGRLLRWYLPEAAAAR
jgi:hypothetical protein